MGITPGTPFSLRNKLKVFNIAILTVLLISCFYAVMAVTHDYVLSTYVTLYSIASCLFTFFLVHKRRYLLAFHFAMLYGYVFLTAFSFVFGRVTNSYLYFLFLPIACNILFDGKKTLAAYFIFSVILTLFNFWAMDNWQPYYAVEIEERWLGYPNIPFVLILIFLSVRMFKNENRKYASQIEEQRAALEERNEEITDSINYARRIQSALLAPAALMKKNLPEHFVFYKPKAIVSGDFYWAAESVVNDRGDKRFWLCVGDCTGHGVPGAFMSLMNISILRELISDGKISAPDLVLNKQREAIITALNPDGAEESGKDGMDCALLCLNPKNNLLQFACANNPVWIFRDRELIEYKADKQPIGLHEGIITPFTLHAVQLQKGDMVIALTDGYADQFGGPRGKKYKYSQLKALLQQHAHENVEALKAKLAAEFENWQGNTEQVDDVLIVGIKI